jgi:Bacterial membrane protein YfhO
MDSSIFKKLLPHGIAIVIMVALSMLFFLPNVSEGLVLNQHDNVQAAASQSELDKYKAETGHAPLWAGTYFSGMPAFQIHIDTKGNLTMPIFRLMLAGQPMSSYFAEVFLAMLCMYLLLSVMRLDWRLSLLGAIAFGISTFNMDIIAAGHSTKMVALAFAPGVLAGAILAFRGQYIIGSALFALFVAMQMYANHYQITYYTVLILAVLGISELVHAVRGKDFLSFGKGALSLVVGLALAVLSNLTTIWTTLEYQTESTRGKTELSADMKKAIQTKQGGQATSDASGGLTKDYAFGWSYGIGETLTLLVQNAYGGGSSQNYVGTDAESLGQMTGFLYMGKQPFVGVGIYYGAIIVFLFVLGLFLVENRWRWSIFAASFLMIAIAWGGNSFVGNVLYDTFPLFNKFRAHTQALGLGQMLFALMAMLTLQKFFDPSVTKETKQKALLYATGITGVLCLMAMFGDSNGANDAKYAAQYGQQFSQALPAIKEARAAVAKGDSIRSLMFILAAAAILWATLRGLISKSWMAVAAIGLLCFGDIWTASRRVIYDEKFQSPAAAQKEVQPSPVDQLILKDKELSFRVLDLRGGSPFENANTSMFHKSVGGYHAAKMMAYQEMRERYLENFEKDVPIFQQKNMPLYGMLNAKYIVLGENMSDLQPNPMALGNAWFVKSVKLVENADAEIEEVGKINPRYETIIQKRYAEKLKGFTPQYDSTASITLIKYHPDKLEYDSKANGDQLAVFSEIYYPMEKGWSMTIDGQAAEFVKANYILRAAKIPSGNHKIVMEFHPKSYYSGETYSMMASGLLLLLLVGGLYWYFRENGLPEGGNLPNLPEPVTEKKVYKISEKNEAQTETKKKKLR